MAYQQITHTVTLKASQDMRNCMYTIVELVAATPLSGAIAAANKGYGVLQNKPNTDEAMTVAVEGESRLRAGLAITNGDLVTAATSGFGVSVVSGAAHPAGGIDIIGRAKTGAASGSVFTVDIQKYRMNPVSGAAI